MFSILRTVIAVALLGVILLYINDHSAGIENNFQKFTAAVSTDVGALVGNVATSSKDTVDKIKDDISLPPPLVLPGTSSSSNGTLTSEGVISLTNDQRVDNGDKVLTENATLDEEALAKADDIFKQQYFEHVNPEGVGPDGLASQYGYQYVTIGENLALGNFASNNDLITAWMNSPGHRANILNSKFEEMGAATLEGQYQGREVWVGVQEFGEPLSACPAISASLQAKINTEKDSVDQYENKLQAEKTQIDDANPSSGDQYDAEVDQYNEDIAAYNAMVAALKADISQYNGEVDSFNSCVQS